MRQPQPPVLKVGAVIIRPSDRAILIVQPIPKRAGEVPNFVLPRGSRQYEDAHGEWHDARDAQTGETNRGSLEPFRRGLEREIEEEAGMTPAQLAKARVIEMGDMDFTSRTKGTYPVHWFVVMPDEATAQTMVEKVPVDAMATYWAGQDEIKVMAKVGIFSAGYLPVIEKALALTRSTPGQSPRGAAVPSR